MAMTVGQLIEELAQFPDYYDTDVVEVHSRTRENGVIVWLSNRYEDAS